MRDEILISVDIEADGPIPGDYSMLSLGATLIDPPKDAKPEVTDFYVELCPMTDKFVPEALAVSGLSREKLFAEGEEPDDAMKALKAWLLRSGAKPIFVGFNATFDWMFTHWYFVHFLGEDPFGIAGLDIKAYFMGVMKKAKWSHTAKRNMETRFLAGLPKHSHNALDDAKEQAELFRRIRAEANTPPLR
jgi:ribonuclease T